jgi:hypothetical protein
MALFPHNRSDGLAYNPVRFAGNFNSYQNHWDYGSRFNRFYGETFSKLSATPVGYYAGGARILPITAGALGGTSSQPVTVSVSGALNEGRNISGSTAISFTVNGADLLLSALISGTSTLTVTLNSPALGAAVGIQGSTSFALTPNTPILGALAGLFGEATVSVNAQGLVTATGNMSGDITPYTELSPQSLAAAVWNALASNYNDAGTMGNKLNTASSGGVDLNALSEAVWEYGTRTLTEGGGGGTVDPAQVWEYPNRTLSFYPITSLPTPEMMAEEIAKKLKESKVKKDGKEDEWKKKLMDIAEAIEKKAAQIPELAKESTLVSNTEAVLETKKAVGKVKNDTALIPLLIETD